MVRYTKITRQLITAAVALTLVGCASTENRRSTGQAIDDASIASRVKTALIKDDLTDGGDIEIEVDRGLVQLNGFANSAAEKKRAEEIANNVSGVSGVDNNLDVVKGDRTVGEFFDDKVLLVRVNGALAKDAEVSAMDIEVEVNRDMVQLGGYVDSVAERRAAEAAANRVDGVSRVVNNIGVRAKN